MEWLNAGRDAPILVSPSATNTRGKIQRWRKDQRYWCILTLPCVMVNHYRRVCCWLLYILTSILVAGVCFNGLFLLPPPPPPRLQWMELRFNTLAKCPHCKKMWVHSSPTFRTAFKDMLREQFHFPSACRSSGFSSDASHFGFTDGSVGRRAGGPEVCVIVTCDRSLGPGQEAPISDIPSNSIYDVFLGGDPSMIWFRGAKGAKTQSKL